MAPWLLHSVLSSIVEIEDFPIWKNSSLFIEDSQLPRKNLNQNIRLESMLIYRASPVLLYLRKLHKNLPLKATNLSHNYKIDSLCLWKSCSKVTSDCSISTQATTPPILKNKKFSSKTVLNTSLLIVMNKNTPDKKTAKKPKYIYLSLYSQTSQKSTRKWTNVPSILIYMSIDHLLNNLLMFDQVNLAWNKN